MSGSSLFKTWQILGITLSAGLASISGCATHEPLIRQTPLQEIATDPVFPKKHWESITVPEQFGYSSERLKEAKKAFEETDADAVMVITRGRVLLHTGNVATVSNIHSARKAMLALMYGKYVSTGKINLNNTMEELGIDDVAGLSELEKKSNNRSPAHFSLRRLP